MKLKLLLIFGLLLGLVACNQAETTAPQSAAETAVEVAVHDLPSTVDVKTAASVQDRDDVLLIDVREQWEYDEGHIPGITLIPMSEIENRLNEIPDDREVIVTCRSGNRSGQVTEMLKQKGFDNVHNMQGGILAWEAAGYPVEQ